MNQFWDSYNEGILCDDMLPLIDNILQYCQGHYTVWKFRREIIKGLSLDIVEELRWTRAFASSNPKNYQVWHHRACLLEMTNSPQMAAEELEAMINDLSQEPKNYHAWQFRQSLLQRFPAACQPAEELKLTEELLRIDPYNNSAWNHRVFILEKLLNGQFYEQAELDHIQAILEKDADNASAKHYLQCISSK